ncbi:MAG TPA: hypothetical protein VGD78_17035, partial [Chthoniobacterales bacterium]
MRLVRIIDHLKQTFSPVSGLVSGSLGGVGCLCAAFTATGLAVDTLTSRVDNARTSLNADEVTLTPANVNLNAFGKLRVFPTDGQVYAQPLYVSSAPIYDSTGANFRGRYNVVIVGSEKNTLSAFNADASGPALWSNRLMGSNEANPTNDDFSCADLGPTFGITATPVIDLQQGPHGRIFVTTYTKSSDGNFHQYLHAIDLATGQDALPAVELGATYPGTGPESSNGTQTFHPFASWNRAGLVLSNRTIYIFFGSHCDNETFTNSVTGAQYANGYSGFIMAYDEGTLKQVAVGNLNPSGGPPNNWVKYGSGNTIWNAGCAPAVDAAGNIYAPTGNGPFNPSQGNYGDSCVKLSTDLTGGRINVVDSFTPFDQATLANLDKDYGSGAAMLIPGQTDANGQKHYFVTANGKDGNLYLLNRDNLGGYSTSGSNDNAYQEIVGGLQGGVWSSPAYFHGALYFGPNGQPLRRYVFDRTPLLKASSSSSSGTPYQYPGASPAISAWGSTNGIVWALQRVSSSAPGVLHAYNSGNLALELWNSGQNSGRDGLDTAVKFVVPTIANGRVFVGTATTVSEFGLLNPTPAVDVTGSVTVLQHRISRSPINGYYRQTVTLTDAGSTVLSAPLSLVLPGLSPNAQLANRSGGTTGSANP